MTDAEKILKDWVCRYFPYLVVAPLCIHEEKVLLRLYLEHSQQKQPYGLVETEFGGWVPNSLGDDALASASQFAQEVHVRNQLRAAKDYAGADLIKKTLVGGSVELLDFPNGTIFYFSSVKLLDA